MGIVELGALGEFVGSIAVLATLIYLTFTPPPPNARPSRKRR